MTIGVYQKEQGMGPRSYPWPRRDLSAFTLVEVILAIVIALGILVVLLYFYEQATNLRTQIIDQTERLSAIRLLMDRITGELRSIQAVPSYGVGLAGSSNFIELIKPDVPSFGSWTGGQLGRSPVPLTDLKRITYSLESSDGTNVAGLLRSEEPLVLKRQVMSYEDQPEMSQTNAAPPDTSLPLIPEIRFLQFRYWAGTNWQDSWNSSTLPEGVEVSLAAEAVTNVADLAEADIDLFRRVVYLPAKALPEMLSSTNATRQGTNSLSEETP